MPTMPHSLQMISQSDGAPPILLADTRLLSSHFRQDRFALSQTEPTTVAEMLRQADKIEIRPSGNCAVVPIHGIIEYRLTFWGWLFGATSCLAIQRAVKECISNPDINRIVFDIDSPGGDYYGSPELCRFIYDSREAIEMVAVANPMAASAAVKFAAACNRFVLMHSAHVGSVGSIIVLESWSRYLTELGVDVTVIRNPEWKAEGGRYEPTSESFKEYCQSLVDRVTGEFHTEMSKYRGVSVSHVKENFGKGRMLWGEQAVSAKLCDAISSLEKEVARGGGKKSSGKTRQEGRERMKQSLDVRMGV